MRHSAVAVRSGGRSEGLWERVLSHHPQYARWGLTAGPFSPGRDSREGATISKKRQRSYLNPLCNIFLLFLIVMLNLQEVGRGE